MTAQEHDRAARRRRPPLGNMIRHKPQRAARAQPDLGTDQTRAKLRLPPWADWRDQHGESIAHLYSRAAIEIDTAWRALCAGLFSGALDMLRAGGYHSIWSASQCLCVARYRVWQARLRPREHLAIVLDAIIDCRPLAPWELAALKDMLDLYLELYPISVDKRTEVVDNEQ